MKVSVEDNIERSKLRNQTFKRFFISSLIGLGVDLLIFQVLVLCNFSLWLANLCSSALAVAVLYFLVSRYTFSGRGSPLAVVIFYTWYFAVIVFFSLLIELTASLSGLPPIFIKAISIPFSFLLNYLFSKYVFKRFLT